MMEWSDLDEIIDEQGWPERAEREPLEDYVGRCFVPVARYEDGAIVEPGSVSYWGTVDFVEIEVSDGGWGNWMLHIAETSEVIDGTLNQRVPRGLLVEGRPVKEGSVLFAGRDRVTVEVVGGLSGLIYAHPLATAGAAGAKGSRPFEPSELSWERDEGSDSSACRCGGRLKELRYFDDCGPSSAVSAAKEGSVRVLAVCCECGAVYAVKAGPR